MASKAYVEQLKSSLVEYVRELERLQARKDVVLEVMATLRRELERAGVDPASCDYEED